MPRRVTKLAAALAAFAAVAAGGTALASGAGKGTSPVPPTSAQAKQGGQMTDGSATDETQPASVDNEAMSETADNDDVRQGDETTVDDVGSSQAEQATASSSDGPGGYADTVSEANTQQEGEH